MAVRATVGRIGLEAALAVAAGVGWFAVCAVLLAEVLPGSPVVVGFLVVVDAAVVVALAYYLGIGYAVTVGVASVVALDWHYIPPTHATIWLDARNGAALATYLVTGVLLGELAVMARRRAEVSEGARTVLAGEQEALRRVATLVARETQPDEVFAAVTTEVGRLLRVDVAALLRLGADATVTVVAAWSRTGRDIRVGTRLDLEGDNVVVRVVRTARPARTDGSTPDEGRLADQIRGIGIRSSVGSPVVVDGRLWGVMVAASIDAHPIPEGVESRLDGFTELAGTAVANAQARAELAASRARIVASADQARRGIERDLHDGVQQRLVALGLGLRMAEELAGAADSGELSTQLGELREEVVAILHDLREISHGIHPAILSEGGLRPALSNLARRSTVPVEVRMDDLARLPEPVEVGAYYVVSEALANVDKHAAATRITLSVGLENGSVELHIRDDGAGGADPTTGSGLVGLTDRVHALGGTITIQSPLGGGTSIRASLPTHRP